MFGALEMLIIVAVGTLFLAGAAGIAVLVVSKKSNSASSQPGVPPIAKPKKD